MTPGSMPLATEIFQEGLIIPPVKLVKKGEIVKDLFELILSNVRTKEERRGDLLAQMAANKKGKQRILEALEKYGESKLLSNAELIQDYTETYLRKTIKNIPDGEYAFEDFMDNDGITDNPVKIGVKIRIRGDQAVIDFSSSSSQVEGGINANYAVTFSAVLYVFRSLVDEDIPFNTGLMRPLKIEAPEGSVVNALHPSATAGGNVETSQRIADVLLGALHQAVPDKIPAASSGTMNNITFGGFDPDRQSCFAYYETIGGGMGASKQMNGLSGVHTHMTNSLNTPLEALENYFPLRISRYSLRPRSGGSGLTKGGDGIIREYEFFVPTRVSVISERRHFAPYGLKGGASGRKGRNTLLSGGKKTALGPKFNIKVKPGDKLRIETPGGGGYGKK